MNCAMLLWLHHWVKYSVTVQISCRRCVLLTALCSGVGKLEYKLRPFPAFGTKVPVHLWVKSVRCVLQGNFVAFVVYRES